MADTIVTADTSNSNDEEVVIDSKLSDAEKVIALEAQNKKIFARAKKAEGFTQDENGKWIKKSSTTETVRPSETITQANAGDRMYTREELDLRMDGYTDAEVQFISKNGGRKSLEDSKSFVSVAIKSSKEQRDAERAASQTSNAGGGVDTTGTKLTVEQMNSMSLKDLEKALPHAPGN